MSIPAEESGCKFPNVFATNKPNINHKTNTMLRFIIRSLASFILLFLISDIAFAQKTIQEGTVIRVRLAETLDSRSANAGDIVNLEVADPILVDGIMVIEPGAKVTGKIIDAVKNKSMGRKGKLDISIDFVRAKDGQNIPLTSNIKQGGKDATVGVVAAAALINPLALFIKGKAAKIDKGTEFNCYIARSVEVKVK